MSNNRQHYIAIGWIAFWMGVAIAGVIGANSALAGKTEPTKESVVPNTMYEVTQRMWLLCPGRNDTLLERVIRIPLPPTPLMSISGDTVESVEVEHNSSAIVADMGTRSRLPAHVDKELAELTALGWTKAN